MPDTGLRHRQFMVRGEQSAYNLIRLINNMVDERNDIVTDIPAEESARPLHEAVFDYGLKGREVFPGFEVRAHGGPGYEDCYNVIAYVQFSGADLHIVESSTGFFSEVERMAQDGRRHIDIVL